jgi:hypothetical protein
MLKAKRFVYWRRSPEELSQRGSSYPVIDTLEEKISQATEMVESEEVETVMVLEIKKVITRAKPPVVVKDL